MMAAEGSGMDLGHAIVLLGAAVVAAPLFIRLGMGSVLGYLIAGLVIGPFGLRFFSDPEAILHVAELGVVLFLFVVGLEMRPAKLWRLRREIFGLGAAQVLTCGVALSLIAWLAGVAPAAAIIGASGFVLSSTAVIMTMLEERGQTNEPSGQRAVSILLLEDLSVIPLLALVAFLAPITGQTANDQPVWLGIVIGLGAIAVVVAAGRWLLNPFFSILARTGARELMTAAALLVVLGSAVFMDWGGLSMAMGAFLAGVLLSESTFRHQLEADIEPFRGILLGLFFVSVGMSLDLGVVVAEWALVIGGVLLFMAVKAACIFIIAKVFGADNREAVDRATLFAQGGEFAFVLYAAAFAAGVLDGRTAAIMTAIVILSMALTPLLLIVVRRLTPQRVESMEGVEKADGLKGRMLLIGFGRFAQLVSQPLLARGVKINLIENDVEMIRVAGRFGFKVYYGDGARLDVLRASGAATAEAILVCIDKPEVADRIVELVKAEFPHARLFVRAYDRGHSIRLIRAGVDYQIRETFESALTFAEDLLVDIGFDPAVAAETIMEVRQRDQERLEMQIVSGIEAGRSLMRGNMITPEPEPLSAPRGQSEGLNTEAAAALAAGKGGPA
jgi:glutathione-regulated potassium-efflux system protein KefB